MSFGVFRKAAIRDLVDRLADCPNLTLVIGAGCSMEVGLPDWGDLVTRLLKRVSGQSRPPLPMKERDSWAQSILERFGYPGAAAIVEALSVANPGDPVDLTALVKGDLYGDQSVDDFLPGPIAREIAELCCARKLEPTLITTNYDDLVRMALTERPYDGRKLRVAIDTDGLAHEADIVVRHLHGYSGRDKDQGKLVLTEEQYQRMQGSDAWQEKLMMDRLENSTCLFVGTSLTDPNLIRYLHRCERREARHAAIFVRESEEAAPGYRRAGERPPLSADALKLRDEALSRKWAMKNMELAFVDHFGDVAQILHEIGLRRVRGCAYRFPHERASDWIGEFDRELIGGRSMRRFQLGQLYLTSLLRSALENGMQVAADNGVSFRGERLGCSLWIADRRGANLRLVATRDVIRWEKGAIMRVPASADSDWIAVQAFTRGVEHRRDRAVYTSRWRHVVGLPLIIDNPPGERLPVGCVTVASDQPLSKSAYSRMRLQVKTAFHETILEAIRQSLAKVKE